MNRDDDQKELDTIIDRSFTIYKENSKNLERIFAILCGAGLFFFFAAIVPYFFIQFEKQRVTEEYDNTINEINETQSAINNTNTKLNRIIELRDEAIPATDMLLDRLNLTINQIESVPETVSASLKENLTMRQQRFEGLKERLFNELSNLENNKTNFEKELNTQINITLPALQNRELSLANDLGNLTSQWQNVQSPIGNLPTGFRDLVAVFPLSLSMGFLLYIYYFSKTLVIRRFLHYLKKKSKKSHEDSDLEKEIALTSPLWIDPLNTEQNKVLSFLALIIPFAIFVASIAMLFYSWNVDASGLLIGESYKMTYYVINVLGLGLFAYGYLYIINEIRHYSNKLSSMLLTSDEKQK